jgi:two-component system, OmpR family, response regulator MtrA
VAAKRALVLDDNADVRSGLEEALTLWGYEADLAEDATQAFEVARNRRPDVLIMDGSALDLIRRVKAEQKDLFVVVFSGWTHLEASAREAGADAFVLKPELDDLERVLTGRAS